MPRQAVQRKLPWADSCEYHRCSVCGAPQPTARLLDIHLSEMHDSFFAAQAARKLKVRLGFWHILHLFSSFKLYSDRSEGGQRFRLHAD